MTTTTERSLDLEIPLYHQTSIDTYQRITEEGFVAGGRGKHRQQIEQDLLDTAAEMDAEFPVARQDCVFFYPFFETVRDHTPSYTQSYHFDQCQAIIAVEGQEIEPEMYIGDYHMYDCAYHLTWLTSPDPTMKVDSREDAMRKYVNSLTKVESRAELTEICNNIHAPEILIQGRIEPDCIREVMYRKAVCCSGLPVLASNYRRSWPHGNFSPLIRD